MLNNEVQTWLLPQNSIGVGIPIEHPGPLGILHIFQDHRKHANATTYL